MNIEGRKRERLRAISITTGTTLTGIAAALVSAIMTAGADPAAAATDTTGMFVVPAAIALQYVLYDGVFDDWGGGRDLLFVVFMTFCLWFITWGIILSTGAEIF